MKIGYFSDTYRPHKNGVATALSIQKKNFEEEGHELHLFIPYIPNSLQEKNVYKLPSITFPFQKEHRIAVPFSLKYDLLLNKIDLKIIHTHTPFSLGIFGWYEARKRKIPLVHTYHTLFTEYAYYIWDHFPGFIKKHLITEKEAKDIAIWMSKTYCNLCDLIIAPSTKVKKLLIDFGVKSPIEILPNGLDIRDFKPIDKNLAREKLNLPKDAMILLFVGRLGKEKNIEYLLKVEKWLKLNTSYPIYLVIVGDNPDKRVLEGLRKEAEELDIEDRVKFTGYLEYEDIANAYFASDIFVFPSLTETQGLVVLEALTTGLPVIALQDEAIGDFVGDEYNGFLIPHSPYKIEESIYEFGRKIIELINNKELYFTLSENAIKSAKDYSVQEINRKLLSIYERLIWDYNK
ncbi:MAG: glycosyltransferase family 4 protein [Dictyoglomaceae bacterium]|nr:glycosyltransferase family 4 protein [Dictyoglomaceae bacterium]